MGYITKNIKNLLLSLGDCSKSPGNINIIITIALSFVFLLHEFNKPTKKQFGYILNLLVVFFISSCISKYIIYNKNNIGDKEHSKQKFNCIILQNLICFINVIWFLLQSNSISYILSSEETQEYIALLKNKLLLDKDFIQNLKISFYNKIDFNDFSKKFSNRLHEMTNNIGNGNQTYNEIIIRKYYDFFKIVFDKNLNIDDISHLKAAFINSSNNLVYDKYILMYYSYCIILQMYTNTVLIVPTIVNIGNSVMD